MADPDPRGPAPRTSQPSTAGPRRRAVGLALGLLLAMALGWLGPGDALAVPSALISPQVAGSSTGAGADDLTRSNNLAGSYELAGVHILGMRVITVASEVVGEDGSSPDAGKRAEVIEGNLRLLYEGRSLCSRSEHLTSRAREWLTGTRDRACDASRQWGLLGRPEEVYVVINEEAAGQYVLAAQVPARDDPLPLLTVTRADAALNGIDEAQLAQRWRRRLEERLRLARLQLQPRNLARRWLVVLLVEGVLLALTVACFRLWNRNRIHLQRLRQASLRPLDPRQDRRLQLRHTLGRALLLAVLLGALAMAALTVMAVPGQESLALELLIQPSAALLKLLTMLLVTVLCRGLVAFLLSQWADNLHVRPHECCRRDQRHQSLLRVSQRLIDLGGFAIALLWILVDVPGLRGSSASLLVAGGAVLGALAFVFQDFVRDFVAGLVSLLEDRYTIGDFIEIDGLAGTVIDVSVLSTQMRCLDQRVVVSRNSDFNRLINHTKLRSGSVVTVTLSHQCRDIDRALEVVRQVSDAFGVDPDWSGRFHAPPVVRGVQRITPLGIQVEILLTTRAGLQWESERELQRRLLERLNKDGIPLADGLEVVVSGR